VATAEAARKIFDSLVGLTESPPGSNCTPIIKEFGYPQCAAWCAMTDSVVLKRVFGRKVLWTAGVADAIARAKRGENDLQWLERDAVIRLGDLPCFDFGGRGRAGEFHISFVRDPGTQVKFQTDGGNERDAVRQQWRDRKFVMGFIRPPYDDTPTQPDQHGQATNDHQAAPAPISQEDDDMVTDSGVVNPGESRVILFPFTDDHRKTTLRLGSQVDGCDIGYVVAGAKGERVNAPLHIGKGGRSLEEHLQPGDEFVSITVADDQHQPCAWYWESVPV
jgi:hypothetical protein